VDKLVKYGAIAFLIFFVVTQPDSAAGIIGKGIDWLQNIGEGMSSFVSDTVL
jgi:hypothetical protein